jgi:hypothetical protein
MVNEYYVKAQKKTQKHWTPTKQQNRKKGSTVRQLAMTTIGCHEGYFHCRGYVLDNLTVVHVCSWMTRQQNTLSQRFGTTDDTVTH